MMLQQKSRALAMQTTRDGAADHDRRSIQGIPDDLDPVRRYAMLSLAAIGYIVINMNAIQISAWTAMQKNKCGCLFAVMLSSWNQQHKPSERRGYPFNVVIRFVVKNISR
jgi:hypothetical protein